MSSWNVNSFSIKSENKFIYKWLDKDRSNLHIFSDTWTDINSETRYKEHVLHFNLYASNSRWIVVLRKSSFPVSDFKTQNIIPGNFTKISFTFNSEKYVILSLYLKEGWYWFLWRSVFRQTDRKLWPHDVCRRLDYISLNQLLDMSGYLHENNVESKKFIKEKMSEKELTDLRRVWKIDKFEYSWSKYQRKNRTLAWRDFLLPSKNVTSLAQLKNGFEARRMLIVPDRRFKGLWEVEH